MLHMPFFNNNKLLDRSIQSTQDLNNMLFEIAKIKNRLASQETAHQQRLAQLTERHAQKTGELKKDLTILTGMVKAWCELHKQELLEEAETRSLTIEGGTIGWRKTKKRLLVDDPDKAVAELEAKGLERYLNTSKTLKKTALLTDWETLPELESLARLPGEDQFFIET